jgi:tRNA A37 threonylcarbamoyltransferase TsaD
LEKPLIAVNHLEGHIHAVLLEQRQSENGETCIFRCWRWWSRADTRIFILPRCDENLWTYRNIGHTRDDAGGEAFDKVAKLLGLGYPGGPIIDRLAPHGDPHAVKFQMAQIKHATGAITSRAIICRTIISTGITRAGQRRMGRSSTFPTAESRRRFCATWRRRN